MFESIGPEPTVAGFPISEALASFPENPVPAYGQSRVMTCPPGSGRVGQVNQSVVCEPTETIFENATHSQETMKNYANWYALAAIAVTFILLAPPKGGRLF